MNLGVFYGIGVGPGDPDLLTIKGAKILASCPHVFVPTPKFGAASLALSIAKPHIHYDAVIHEILFPMTSDKAELSLRWQESARTVSDVLANGSDGCFLTLGDAFLYSTYIYLLRELRKLLPDLKVVTVPGVTAFSAAASMAEFPVGEAKETVVIVPTADDLREVERALTTGGTVILMKIGKRLPRILDCLRQAGALDRAVFVSRVGLEGEKIETDLTKLQGSEADMGYMSIILVRGRAGVSP